jgi:hypothetical protein
MVDRYPGPARILGQVHTRAVVCAAARRGALGTRGRAGRRSKVKAKDDGMIEFHITLRDGSVHVVPGLPITVYTKLPMGITAHQAEGSDAVTLGGARPVTHEHSARTPGEGCMLHAIVGSGRLSNGVVYCLPDR